MSRREAVITSVGLLALAASALVVAIADMLSGASLVTFGALGLSFAASLGSLAVLPPVGPVILAWVFLAGWVTGMLAAALMILGTCS